MEESKELKENLSVSCRDCTTSLLFSLVRLLIYVLSAIALSNNSSEIVKNIWSVVK